MPVDWNVDVEPEVEEQDLTAALAWARIASEATAPVNLYMVSVGQESADTWVMYPCIAESALEAVRVAEQQYWEKYGDGDVQSLELAVRDILLPPGLVSMADRFLRYEKFNDEPEMEVAYDLSKDAYLLKEQAETARVMSIMQAEQDLIKKAHEFADKLAGVKNHA